MDADSSQLFCECTEEGKAEGKLLFLNWKKSVCGSNLTTKQHLMGEEKKKDNIMS